jgi:NADPH:quinone reductase-like Zn-dependent oxidoreductase/SAM-dependent methyltransferase/acyl carrier protein
VDAGGGDLWLQDRDGHLLAELRGLRVQSLEADVQEESSLRDGAYCWRWIASPAPSRAAIAASPSALVQALQPAIHETALALRHQERVRSGNAMLDQLALAFIVEAFEVLGSPLQEGRILDPSETAERLRVIPAQRQLFRSLLGILEEEGALERHGEGFRVARRPEIGSSSELYARFSEQRPDYHAELELLRRCGGALASVLWGRVEPLSLVFPKETNTSEHLYQDAPSLRLNNVMAREVVAALSAALPEGRTLRILEVGAGTGGTAAHLLPVVCPDRTRYVYTDLSATFTARARERFQRHDFVEYRALDISQDPAAQGLEPGSFDVIVAANVLHATPDLQRSIEHAGALLAPGGLLMMLEITNLPRMVKLTFGQLRDWWSFTDRDLRQDHPCLSFASWTRLLESTGFEDIARFEDPAGDENSLVLARRRAPAPAPAPLPSLTGRWLLLGDATSTAPLARAFEARGASIEVIDPRGDVRSTVASALHQGPPARGLVHLASLAAPPNDLLDPGSFEASMEVGLYTALHAIQAINDAPEGRRPALYLVTRGAVNYGNSIPSMAQSPLWGLGRVAINEHTDLRIKLIDLDPPADPAEALVRECGREEDGEHEVAWRDGVRLVRRLTPAPWTEEAAPGAAMELDGEGLGRSAHRSAPGAGEVELRALAAGLDGGELVGRIVSVGPGVDGLPPGSLVLGYGNGQVASYQRCAAEHLVLLRGGIAPEAAASLPLAFLAVHTGLEELARVRPGELAVVADATSAMGQLALAELRRLGVDVVAVAGSAASRERLRALGLAAVVDGKLPHVADEILRQTGGRRPDLVFHTGTAAPPIEGLAQALRPWGRVVHAAQNARDRDALAAVLLERSLAYLPASPVQLLQAQPHLARRALEALGARLEAGSLAPPPYRAIPPGDVPAARSTERRARTFGAQIIALEREHLRVLPAWASPLSLRPDATYLITGGLRGVGLETARFLAAQGARNLVLAGRSGASSEEARATVSDLEQRGLRVLVARVDVSEQTQLADLLARLRSELPPLRGVIHGAMVLDDGFLSQLTPERFRKVLAPKALGAWNLHTLTREDPLDFFVLYSSIASVGLRGQANYVAANVFLDTLAGARRAMGLPGLTLNWGVVGDIGYVSRNAQLYGYFDQQGMRALRPREVMTALGYYLRRGLPQAFVFPVDWGQLGQFAPAMVRSPRFWHLVERAEGRDGGAAVTSDAARLQALRQCTDPQERRRLVKEYVTQVVAGVLGLDQEQLDGSRPITELGLDSMMAIELSGRLQASLRVDLPVARLLAGATVEQLATILAGTA